MQHITNDNYEELVSKNELIVIDFYADWCAPCKMYGPIFEEAETNIKDALLVKCNVEEGKRVAARFGIRSIPTTVIIKNKEMIVTQPGIMQENQLKELINQYK